jgi:hypothetical protein
MKNYINKANTTTIKTVTTTDEFYIQPNSSGMYYINGVPILEANFIAQNEIVKTNRKFYYSKNRVIANNFTKSFETPLEMETWMTNNFPTFLLISEEINSAIV